METNTVGENNTEKLTAKVGEGLLEKKPPEWAPGQGEGPGGRAFQGGVGWGETKALMGHGGGSCLGPGPVAGKDETRGLQVLWGPTSQPGVHLLVSFIWWTSELCPVGQRGAWCTHASWPTSMVLAFQG